jgi:peptide/nickel transport system substrate-binding protein
VFLTGRVAAEANGRVLDEARFPGRQGRLLFVYLVAARSRPVPVDELADAIWGESPPATWEKALTVIASKLRGLVAADGITLTNAFGCYRLDLPEATWVDLFAAAGGARDAEEALAAGELDQARAAAESAESLAHRPFLSGEDGAWVERERRDLADIRERALSVLTDACLRSGDAREAAKWAEELIALSPFAEAGYRRLMEAHVAAGNRAEALRVYEQCRQLLAEELGAYPSPETDSIYRDLLEAPPTSVRTTLVAEPTVGLSRVQTEALPLRAEQVVERRSRKRRAVLLSALAGVVAAAVVVLLVVFGHGVSGGRSAVSAAGDSLGVVDARSGRLVAATGVGATPTAVAVGEGAYWVTNADGHSVSRIDPGTKVVVDTIPVGNDPTGIAFGDGVVWVVNSGDGTVSRIDPGTDTVVKKIGVGVGPLGIVYAAGSVWVANTGDGTTTMIDPKSDIPTTLQVAATEFAFGAGTLWANERAAGQVVRIDPTTGKQVASIQVGNGPTGIAYGDGAAWVANSLDGTVSRIDPETNSQAAVIPVGNGPSGVAVDSRGVWVSNQFGGTLVRIDPRTNRPGRPVSVGNRPQGIAVTGSKLLVALRGSGSGHRGGTLVVRADRPRVIDSIDVALSGATYTFPFLRMIGDGLVALNQVSGLAGAQPVPDLATSLPSATDGGKTYTFLLRSGIRYSNGRPVQPTDFRSDFERGYALAGNVSDFDELVGGAQCRKKQILDTRRAELQFAVDETKSAVAGLKKGTDAYTHAAKAEEKALKTQIAYSEKIAKYPPKPCDLSRGIVANDVARTVAFHLVRPDPYFLYKLASPAAYAVPGGTPRRPAGTHPLPATGPYMIATYRPKKLLRFVRNPFFREWSRAAQPDGYPDRIDIRIGGTSDEAIRDVVDGKADVVWLGEPLTPKQVSRLKVRYRSQFHSNPRPNVQALFLNTRVPPFNRLDARKAINFAVDRAAATNAWGGRSVAQLTCQILPPNFPGYRPYCPYTAGSTKSGKWSAPDLTKARALVARSGTRGMRVTLWAWSAAKGFNGVALRVLKSLGYHVAVKPVGGFDKYWNAVGDPRNRAQIGFDGHEGGYPSPATFLVELFSCPASDSSQFCNPGIDRQMRRAEAEQQSDPTGARALWQRVDREITDASPWVSLMATKDVNFLSKRVGNYQFSPDGMGLLIDQLWVQ